MRQRGVKDIEMIVEEARIASDKLLPHVNLYPDAVFVLESLRTSGKKLALVTTSKHSQIDISLAKYNLQQLFDAVVCGDDVTHIKPDAEPLEKAISLLGGDKKLSIMIGDSDKDIEAATNAGIDSVLFHSEQHGLFYDLEILKDLGSTYTVTDFKDILRLA